MSPDLGSSEVAWHLDFDTASALASAPEEDLAPEPPAHLDELFELQGALGSGGMGLVYRAFDRRLGRPVALKLVKASTEERAKFRLQAEGRATARLDHPGVVRVHGAGVASGRAFLVYELIEGGRSLEEACAEASLEERLRWITEVAEALGAAHALGIVHRDVKGENVLVDREGRARVLDFGIAVSSEEERLTLTGETVGTPLFMAPERFAGREGPPSDVWSLGVLLYQALTGELPYQAENLMRLIALLQTPPIPPRRLASDVPPALEAICLRCLARDPAERYPTGLEVAEALRALDLEPRARSFGALGVSLALLLLLSLAAAFWLRARPRVWETPQAVEAFLANEGPEAWRDALDHDSFADPELRARVALELAAAPSLPRAERLAIATRSAAAAPSWRAALLMAELQESGEEAAASLLAAQELGSPRPELELALAQVLGADEVRAGRALERLLQERSRWAPRRWSEPGVRALLKAGRPELAAQLLAATRSEIGAERAGHLEAELARVRGEDLRPVLEAALAAAPSSTSLQLELAQAFLSAGDAQSARNVLRGRGEANGPAARLLALIQTPQADAPRSWRVALARCEVSDARRELALSRRASAVSLETRLDRARAATQRLASLGVLEPEREALEIAWGLRPPGGLRSNLAPWAAALQAEAFLRASRGEECREDAPRLPPALAGRVLLAAGETKTALARLEEACSDPLADATTLAACAEAAKALAPERAPAWAARAEAAADPKREDAAQRLADYQASRTRGSTFEDEVARLSAIAAQDPHNLDAQHYLARARFLHGEPEGLLHALRVAGRAPRYLSPLCRIALQSEERRAFVRAEGTGEVHAPLSRTFLDVMKLEAGAKLDPADLVSRLDRILADEPGNQAARTLRGFVAIRADRLGLAEADLDCVLEDDPRAGQARFYRALLAGAQRAPDRLLRDLNAAKELGFYYSGGRRPEAYPELRPYLDLPGFSGLARPR